MTGATPARRAVAARRSPALAIIAIIVVGLSLLWYLGIFATGGFLFILLVSPGQIFVWVTVLAAAGCALFAWRRGEPRGVVIAALLSSGVAVLVAVIVGAFTGFHIIT